MSFAMRLVWIYFLLRKKFGLAKIGQPPRSPAKPSSIKSKGLSIELEEVSGFKVYRVTPKTFNKRVVYFHGGGYVQPIASQHWKLITELARASQAEFLVPLYGLAPNHTVDEALELAEQIRLSLDFSIPTFLAGDSAGGGLALSLAQGNWRQLKRLILISPWVDSTFGPKSEIYAKRDPWLNPESLRYIATIWSGVADFRRVEVSPLLGNMDSLPDTTIYAGDYELFYPELVELFERMSSSGVHVRIVEQRGGLHVFPLIPSKEGIKARKELLSDLEI